jgi:hypothetical protein|tara:strand:+ start:990 stop:1352 length:363 start_codon:yes stop_codon:yes gene_type:complete
MALVNKIEKKIKMSKDEVIKYQFLTHCFLNDIQISASDLQCLHALSVMGKVELTKFCETIALTGIFKSSQSCRNALSKAEKKGLVVKDGENKKKIFINPKMEIEIEGIILLDYKILSFES